jgi:hypothetical protein
MNDNLNVKILESYVEIDKIHDDINNRLFNFITKANELVELSEDDYQIEKTLLLNKISLKGFVLDSDFCAQLAQNNIVDYSINELKNYLFQYEKTYNTDCFKYHLALSLYEEVEQIEKLVNSKIDLEIKELNYIILDINTISSIDKSEYEKLYINSKNQLDDYYGNGKLADKSYNICIQMLNDIFNFYIRGYPNIPDEYLYKSDDLQ